MWQIWSLPFYITLVTIVLSIPVGFYLAWIMDGKYRAPRWLHWFEERVNTGGQNWKQYTVSILLFSTVMFLFSMSRKNCSRSARQTASALRTRLRRDSSQWLNQVTDALTAMLKASKDDQPSGDEKGYERGGP